MLAMIVIIVVVLAVSGLVLYAMHRSKPSRLKLTASLLRLASFTIEVELDDRITGGSRVEAVRLRDFERNGPAEVVRHGRIAGISGYLFEADESWKIIARAEFLLKIQPKLKYNLIGHNCEHIANMVNIHASNVASR